MVAKKVCIKEIAKANGKRISKEAVEIICEYVEEFAKELVERAAEISTIARRKTITKDDVKLAIKYY